MQRGKTAGDKGQAEEWWKEQEEATKKAIMGSPLMQRMAHCDQPDGLNDQQCEWFYQRFSTGALCIVSAIPEYET